MFLHRLYRWRQTNFKWVFFVTLIELYLFILGLNRSLTFVAIFLALVDLVLTPSTYRLIEEDRTAKEDGTSGTFDFCRLKLKRMQLYRLQLQVTSVLMTIVLDGHFLYTLLAGEVKRARTAAVCKRTMTLVLFKTVAVTHTWWWGRDTYRSKRAWLLLPLRQLNRTESLSPRECFQRLTWFYSDGSLSLFRYAVEDLTNLHRFISSTLHLAVVAIESVKMVVRSPFSVERNRESPLNSTLYPYTQLALL